MPKSFSGMYTERPSRSLYTSRSAWSRAAGNSPMSQSHCSLTRGRTWFQCVWQMLRNSLL